MRRFLALTFTTALLVSAPLLAPLPAAAQLFGPAPQPTVQEPDPGIDHTARDKDLPQELRRASVFYRSDYPPGTIIVNTADRFLYLVVNNQLALRYGYRIHGTNAPETIGQAVSSGCFRLVNEDVSDLYSRVPVGTKVIVQHQ